MRKRSARVACPACGNVVNLVGDRCPSCSYGPQSVIVPEPPHAAMIDLLIDRAPAMRQAGILNLSIDGLSIVLAEATPEPAAAEKHDQHPPAPVDPFDDPATYGRSRLPGFTRPKESLP